MERVHKESDMRILAGLCLGIIILNILSLVRFGAIMGIALLVATMVSLFICAIGLLYSYDK